ncbi:MAG: DUF2207 domain-containing protein [Anderseniella sp.]
MLIMARTLFVSLLVMVSLSSLALAEEQILNFNSRIEVARNGDLTVTETIRVKAEGRTIRRGIFRDFPLVFQGPSKREHRVSFDVIEVLRNGQPEDFRLDEASRAIRVYIGKANRFLENGEHTFTIKYKSDRQIRFFDTHDELYWNVTGNFWDFPIQIARAEVILPDGVRAVDTNLFTGPFGAVDQNASSSYGNNRNKVEFQTTRPLQRNWGLTIAVKMPKGSITPPSEAQKLSWFWRDNKPYLGGFVALLVVFSYYFWAWRKVGRDPPAGVVVPRWYAPDGIPPAQVHYIENKGISGHDALSAALLNLAVKGYVKLDEIGKDIKITTLTAPTDQPPLPVGEALLLARVATSGGSFKIEKSNSSKVLSMITGFNKTLYDEHRNKFFVKNLGYVVAGVILSIVTVVLCVLAVGNVRETLGPAFVMTIAAFMITIVFTNIGFKVARGNNFGGKLKSVMRWFIFGFMALNFLPVIGSMVSQLGAQPLMLMIIGSIVALNVLFWYLLGAPTPLGRKYMDGIEGLKTYINLAEKDRMNLAGAPRMSPQHFEKVLPYAVSLGLEKPWSNAFQAWLATAAGAAAAASYNPHWYSGRGISTGRIGDVMSGLPASISQSMTNSMPAPSSSSSGFGGGGGGGGGSSGGGGGGGGGGGW